MSTISPRDVRIWLCVAVTLLVIVGALASSPVVIYASLLPAFSVVAVSVTIGRADRTGARR